MKFEHQLIRPIWSPVKGLFSKIIRSISMNLSNRLLFQRILIVRITIVIYEYEFDKN